MYILKWVYIYNCQWQKTPNERTEVLLLLKQIKLSNKNESLTIIEITI